MCCARARYAPIFELSTPFCCATFFSCAKAGAAAVQAARNTNTKVRRGRIVPWEGNVIASPRLANRLSRGHLISREPRLQDFCNTNQSNKNPQAHASVNKKARTSWAAQRTTRPVMWDNGG